MGLAEWLAEFRALHDKAKKGALTPTESNHYLAGREELARALLAAQRVQTSPGQSHRSALRVNRALQATLEVGGESTRAMTVDLSVGGFGALLSRAPGFGEKVRYTLRLPGGHQVEGAAKVAGIVPRAGSARVAFTFERLADGDREAVEQLVFDTVLEQMRAPK